MFNKALVQMGSSFLPFQHLHTAGFTQKSDCSLAVVQMTAIPPTLCWLRLLLAPLGVP